MNLRKVKKRKGLFSLEKIAFSKCNYFYFYFWVREYSLLQAKLKENKDILNHFIYK